MSDTKIKVNYSEGYFEIEGSESFVEKHWEEMKSFFEKQSVVTLTQQTTKSKKTKVKKSGKKIVTQVKVDLKLIPLNLKGDDNKPSLLKFCEEKSPSSEQERVTVFAYYLKKYLKIDEMKPGHALYCYTEVKKKKPLQILQVFRDTGSLKGWIEPGVEANTTRVTIGGENLVVHDLPHKTGKSRKK